MLQWCPVLHTPSGICLPGTELLQSPFMTEFSMGSRLRRYRRSLRHHRRFLQNYRQSLRRCCDPWGDRRAWDLEMWCRRSLSGSLNIIKRSKTSWTISKTSWTISKTMWNIMEHSSFDSTISRSMRRRRRLAQQRRRSRGGHLMW